MLFIAGYRLLRSFLLSFGNAGIWKALVHPTSVSLSSSPPFSAHREGSCCGRTPSYHAESLLRDLAGLPEEFLLW